LRLFVRVSGLSGGGADFRALFFVLEDVGFL
jgi:hypothetical protein